ncbi:hypothetical protein WUBG_00328 [Wuchereria bancrofti]|uniref:Uncharacterized protein n=1 Tax=Wuchereria bancrofti TaxID=6293 RepID=J9F1J2_WUCBA|nr:hypothetical protein WUBG_00328 [Wuchereria bancrofti]
MYCDGKQPANPVHHYLASAGRKPKKKVTELFVSVAILQQLEATSLGITKYHASGYIKDKEITRELPRLQPNRKDFQILLLHFEKDKHKISVNGSQSQNGHICVGDHCSQ